LMDLQEVNTIPTLLSLDTPGFFCYADTIHGSHERASSTPKLRP
jgi:hypothetical protein